MLFFCEHFESPEERSLHGVFLSSLIAFACGMKMTAVNIPMIATHTVNSNSIETRIL